MTKRGDTDMDTRRNLLKKKQRVVIKIGSSSLQHTETGDMSAIWIISAWRFWCGSCAI